MDYQKLLKTILSKKFVERVTHNMFDSGDYYGRRYDINRHRNLEEEDALRIEVYDSGILFSYRLFHFLKNFMKIDEETQEMQKKFDHYVSRNDESYGKNMVNFGLDQGFDAHSGYTYNGQVLLDQDFIYTSYCDYSADSALYGVKFMNISLHGGCDARGGFGSPLIFKLQDEDDITPMLMAMTDVHASVPRWKKGKPDLYSDSDDAGFTWLGDFDLYYNNMDPHIELDGDNDKVYYIDEDREKYLVDFQINHE